MTDAYEGAFALVKIAADPKGFEQRLKQLQDAELAALQQAEAALAIQEAAGKDRAEAQRLFDLTKHQELLNEKAATELRDRRQKVEEGEKKLARAMSDLDFQRTELRRKIAEREAECERRETDSKDRLARAEAMHANAEKLQKQAEASIDRLQAALVGRAEVPAGAGAA